MKKNENGNYIKFLGTAGARYVVAKQLRYSGGTYLHLRGKNIIIDPGPGTLVRMARSRPPIDITRLDAIILTHMHIDHSSDVNALIDAMTAGGYNKHGVLYAPDECLNGENRVVLNYLRGFLQDIRTLKEKTAYRNGNLSFVTSVRHQHSAETYGVIFNGPGGRIAFMADTKMFPSLLESYRGVSVLVMNVVFYEPHGNIMHLSVDDVKTIVGELRPRQTILTHLGMSMVRVRPWELSKRLSDELGADVRVATDGMTVNLS